MKHIFLFFLLFGLSPIVTFAQNSESDGDHTFLDEIQINASASSKKKLQLVKLTGRSAYNGVTSMKKIVTLVENIPDGKISFVEFYFNTGMINLFKEKLNIEYDDTEFALLIYENDNGKLGNLISEGDIRFTVGKKHRGAYRLDLASMGLQYNKIFIGFERLTDDTNKNNAYVKLIGSEKTVSYSVSQNIDDTWREFAPELHLKLTIGVEK